MTTVRTTSEAHALLLRAAIALAVIPLINNIDDSLNQEWTQDTFDATDKVIGNFIETLESLGFIIVPTVDPETVFQRTGQGLAVVEEMLAKQENLPVQ